MATAMDLDDAPAVASVPRLQINLSTRDPTLAVPLQALRVPINLKRYGLSTLVNHLLETPKPIPFDFLIDGQYLRSSLDDYLTQAGLSSEKPLDVEYVRSQLPPTYIGSFEQDDWISSVHLSSSSILTGSYDGTAQITSLSGQVLAKTIPLHAQSVKTVAWLAPSPSADTQTYPTSFLTAGMDRTINLWTYPHSPDPPSSTTALSATTTYISHKSTITSLSYSPSTSQFLSSSADHTVALWSTDSSLLPTVSAPQPTAFSRKRRRTTTKHPATEKKGPLAVLTPHTAPVSQVIHTADPTAAYSVSWDKSIVTHDLVTAQVVDTRLTQHPLLPDSEYVFASASHDGCVRIWDVRSVSSSSSSSPAEADPEGPRNGASLFIIKRESGAGKTFGVDWSKDVGLVSVGEDKKIQINRGEMLSDVTILEQTEKP
ncbi:hypothetical protein DRE_06607 [Drechslerella stenobrocha 248]|uniref:NLE domain-containing protein n=1 Tax=Drechslerella stenobrocha 248 TaxID=1043628 RepID=W7HXH6_9PEZI|nr:hypothetical protein DRE_06607 [Drechslerella stenobrocha 248]